MKNTGLFSSRRRALMQAAACAPFAWPASVLAQAARPPIVGYLATSSKDAGYQLFMAFKEGLEAYGWKDGVSVILEHRWAGSDRDRLDVLAQELALLKPRVIVGAPNSAIFAAAKAAPTVPLVQANGNESVVPRLAASLRRPGGTMTGLVNGNEDISEKNIELLLAARPNLRRIGVLSESTGGRVRSDAIRQALAKAKVQGHFAEVRSAEEIETAIATLAKEGAQALIILGGNLFPSERKRIAQLALKYRMPAIGALGEYAEEGLLLSYGANRPALYRRAAYFVDRILKGTKPGDLPIEFPTKFDLTVNRSTARKLGLTLTQELLLRAEKVIE